jgi:RNA polymerase sigma-70 factor (ECF subfamily)
MKSDNSKDRNISTGKNDGDKLSGVSKVFLEQMPSLKKYVSRFINHPHDIEDIVHDAFLNSYAAEINTKIHTPKAFLFTTAKHLALKKIGSSTTRLTDYLEDLDRLEVIGNIAPLDETIEGLEQFALFCKAVQKLPLQCRRVFILRKVYGLTHKEIAEHLDISVSTIEKHLATGISRCSDYMRSKGYGFKVKMPGKVTQPGRKT